MRKGRRNRSSAVIGMYNTFPWVDQATLIDSIALLSCGSIWAWTGRTCWSSRLRSSRRNGVTHLQRYGVTRLEVSQHHLPCTSVGIPSPLSVIRRCNRRLSRFPVHATSRPVLRERRQYAFHTSCHCLFLLLLSVRGKSFIAVWPQETKPQLTVVKQAKMSKLSCGKVNGQSISHIVWTKDTVQSKPRFSLLPYRVPPLASPRFSLSEGATR